MNGECYDIVIRTEDRASPDVPFGDIGVAVDMILNSLKRINLRTV